MSDSKQALISIIIPVYNSEKYIAKCLDAVIAQSYENIEIIAVNDGSKDGSAEIISEYAEKDQRIRLINKENGGVSSARNIGLQHTQGEFFIFVDSDDVAKPDMCEKLMAEMRPDVGLVIGGYESVFENMVGKSYAAPACEFNTDEIGQYMGKLMECLVINSPFAKLYRSYGASERVFFDKTMYLGEDLKFNLDYMDGLKDKIVCITDIVYGYTVDNYGAVTKSFRRGDLDQEIKLNAVLREFMNKHGGDKYDKLLVDRRLYINGMNYLLMVFGSKLSYGEKKQLLREAFEREEYAECCLKKYRSSVKDDIYRVLCRHRSLGLIALFYSLYSRLKR